MAVTRTTNPLSERSAITYAAAAQGSRATLTVTRPGVVKVTTTGDQHAVVDHISYYLDIEAHIYRTGPELVRVHVAYRHGNQADPVTDEQRAAVLDMVTGWLDELVDWAGTEEIGVVGDDADDAAERFELANVRRALESATATHATLQARQAELVERLAKVREDRERLAARAQELSGRIHAREQASR